METAKILVVQASFANDLYTFTPDVQFLEGLINIAATIVDHGWSE